MAPKDEEELQHMVRTGVDCPTPIGYQISPGKGVGTPMSPLPQLLEIGRENSEARERRADRGDGFHGLFFDPCSRETGGGWNPCSRHQRPVFEALDAGLICHWAARIGKVLTVEENVLQGGFGSAILELFQEKSLLISK